jgi:hypothetical protein
VPPSLEPLFFPAVIGVVGDLVWVDVGGFQFRKEVQILQGLPSGPRTVPGGSGRAVGVGRGDFPVAGLALALVLVVLPCIVTHAPNTPRGLQESKLVN